MPDSGSEARTQAPPDLERAITLHKSGDLREAARIYQRILDGDPSNARVWAMLAQIWSSRLLFQRAADCLQRAIEADRGQFLYHFFLAGALRRLHRPEDALAALDRAIVLRPDHFDSHVDRIALLEHMERDSAPARSALHAALPGDPGALDRLAEETSASPQRQRVVIEILRRADELDPTSAGRLVRLGDLLRASGQREAAHELYQRALEIEPDVPGAAAALADTCERMGRLDDARWYAGLALQRSPDDVGLNLALARLDRRDGRLREAASRLRTLERHPAIDSRWTYASILTELAWTLDAGGAFDEAFSRFSEAQRILAQRRAAQRHPIAGMRLWLDGVRARTAMLHPGDWTSPPAMATPPVFLVSFFRSGPSALHRALLASGRFVPAPEISLLSDILASARAEYAINEPYPDLLDRLSMEQVLELRARFIAQARPDSSSDPDRPVLDAHWMNIVRLPAIARLFPEARVIVDLDDPRDSVLNAYFEQLMPDQMSVHFTDIENAGRLHAQIGEVYLSALGVLAPAGFSLLEVRGVEFGLDPRGGLERVFGFLGQAMSDRSLRAIRPEGGMPAFSLAPAAPAVDAPPTPDHAPARWKNYERHLETVSPIIGPLVDRFMGNGQ